MALTAPALVKNSRGSSNSVRRLDVHVEHPGDYRLGLETDYSYELRFRSDNDTGSLTARSVYGALYGLETLMQLLGEDGMLVASTVEIVDSPKYPHRGLMIDSGRRFFPVPLVKNLLDTMGAVKLNVLHLHASDHCRFGVESKIFPELTAGLVGDRAGFYTQADIKDLIAYGKSRGIRIVPEFDIPGHARGLIPLEKHGIEFCTADDSRSQLLNDPANSTRSVLEILLGEMASLFEDEVFNIGCDETSARGKCTVKSTFALEREMIQTITGKFDKTPQGWEEILFTEDAATPETIVNGWSSHNASSITATGRRAIESAAPHFYFTDAVPGGPKGWSHCHYDIGTGVPANQTHLVLGGEMSMWSDTYCSEAQCGASKGSAPVGHALFPPSMDDAFSKSIGGMIWPRGFVAAAAFWNYNSAEDPASAAFQQSVYKLNNALQARGSFVCPSNCSCDQLSACGKSYINSTASHGDEPAVVLV